MKRRRLDTLALRALMKATHLLGLALAERIRQYRGSGDRVLDHFAQLQEQTLHVALLREALETLASRWDKIPDRQRPHFSPSARFKILRLKTLLALPADETASTFRVSTGTILRWEQEALGAPEQQTVGSLLKPVPPVRATTTRSAISSTPSPSPASRATAPSPRISPAPAGSSRAGRFSGSARRNRHPFRRPHMRPQRPLAPSAPATRTTCGCWT